MNRYKIRMLQCATAIFSVYGVLTGKASSLLVSLLIYIFLEIFVGNATLHRFYGHRSFEMQNWKKMILTWLAHHIAVGSILGWAGHHRWHHAHSDTANDIHSPRYNGIFHILFGAWKVNIPRKLISDLITDDHLRWWHKNYFRYHLVVIGVFSLLSPWALLFIYAIPNTMCLLSGYAIAIIPHLSGKAKNSLLTEILTFGEGWHDHHHNFPDKYKFSKFDITGLAITLFLIKKPAHAGKDTTSGL